MIWVMQKEQRIKMVMLVQPEIKLTINEHMISNRHRLTCCEVADDDMIWVIQKEQQIKMVMLVQSDIRLTTN